MNIKMVALDLDGTTLNSESNISEKTVKALNELSAMGIEIVVATGRAFESLPKELEKIQHLRYVITSNGAHITDIKMNDTFYSNYLKADCVDKVVYTLEKLLNKGVHEAIQISDKICVEAFTEGVAYIGESDYESIRQNGSEHRDVAYVLRTRKPIKNIFEYMRLHRGYIENISVNFENIGSKQKLFDILNTISGITVTTSFTHNWEIGDINTSKASALEFLCEKLQVKARDDLIAFGDSANDIEMLKLAKIGVAMGNATDDVKEIADFVTRSNDEDGVVRAISKFV